MGQKAASICSESGNFLLPFALLHILFHDLCSQSLLLDGHEARLLPFLSNDQATDRLFDAAPDQREWCRMSGLFSMPSRQYPKRVLLLVLGWKRFSYAARVLGPRHPFPVWGRVALPIAHRWQIQWSGAVHRAGWSSEHMTAPSQQAVR